MVLPIYDGNPMINAFKFTPTAGFSVFRDLLNYLKKDNPELKKLDVTSEAAGSKNEIYPILHNMLIRYCYIPSKKELEFVNSSEPEKKAEVKTKLLENKQSYKDFNTGKKFSISSWTSLKATKSLFSDKYCKSIARAI